MARVFQAKHRSTQQVVALKVAREGEPGREALRREAKLLSRFRHAGLPELVDADETATPPWLAMEWVGHRTLRSLLRSWWCPGAPNVPAGGHWEEARQVLVEICSALAYLHAQGVVHRDVTPDNILVRPGGGALLGDLGLARAFDAAGREPLEIAGVVEGLPGYMAPEQICGDRVDGRADLYALGCVLHEILRGRPIFEGTGAAQIRKHLHDSPRCSGVLIQGVPPELDRMLLRLLEKDPRNRPSSAEEVGEILGQPAARPPLLHRAGLVGRAAVMAAGGRALDAAKVGRASLLLISGEPGAGKTRCLSELGEAANRAGFRVIASGSPPRAEFATLQSAPLDALRQVVEAMLEKPATLQPEDREILARYFRPTAAVDARHDRHQVEAALRRGLAGLSLEQPLLVILDDLQWADEASVAALAALREEDPGIRRVAVTAACRTVEGAAHLEVLRAAGWAVRALEHLSGQEVESLAREMLSGQAVPGELLGVLERQAGGNPFFVSECLRMAVAERVLSREPAGRWHLVGGPDAARTLPVPGSLRELLLHTLKRLSPRAHAAAEVASLTGREVDEELVTRLAGLSSEAARTALRELRDRGVLEEMERGDLRFRHDVFREVVAAQVPDERRRMLHRGCALALESRGVEADPRVAGTMANHWDAAGEPLRACDYLERAGQHALSLGACGDAIAAFRRALELGVEAEAARRARWSLSVAEGYRGQVDLGRAVVWIERALEDLGRRTPRSRPGWAAKLLGAALSQTVLRRWRRPLQAPPELAVAVNRLADCLFDAREGLAFAACTLWGVDLEERLGSEVPSGQYAKLGLLAGAVRAHGLARRYFQRAATSSGGNGTALVCEGLYRALTGELQQSLDLLDRGVSALRSSGAGGELFHALLSRAAVNYQAGRFDVALRELRALRKSERSEGTFLREWTLCGEAGCLEALGRHAEAVAPLEEALSLSQSPDDRLNRFLASGQLAWTVTLLGDHSRGLALAREALELAAVKPCSMQGALGGYRGVALTLLTEWERLGRPGAEVQQLARRAVRLFRACSRRYPIAVAAAFRCAGLLAWLSGSRRRAVAVWRKGLRRCRGAHVRFDEALLHAELGRPGATRDAELHERRATEILGQIGSEAHLAALKAARRSTSIPS